MGRGNLWFCSGALRVALVLATVQLLSFAQNVRSQDPDFLFCERFAIPFGYNCRQYTTMTTDGFLLVAHRISNRPQATSQARSEGPTTEAPAPLPPLCVTTTEQPYQTIPDFVRKSDAPQLSRTTGVQCIPVATTPLIGSPIQEGPTHAQPVSGHGEGQKEADDELLKNYQSSSANRPHPRDIKHEAGMGGQPFSPSAASKANFVHWTIGHRRIGYVGLSGSHNPSVDSKKIPATARESSPPSIKVTKAHRRFRSAAPSHPSLTTMLSSHDVAPVERTIDFDSIEEVTPLPEPQPEPHPEPDEEEDLTPAAPDSQSQPSPSGSGGVSMVDSGEPVLLMHQEFQNGNSWFKHTDDDSDQLLPFLLLNAGFDVWVGHQRATYYAHEHMTLTPADQGYWNWTWDEHAKYDMPALLELVNRESGSTVHFVGISQSATAGAAAATMPFVSPLLRSLSLIGPTIYRGNTTSRTLNAWVALLGSNIDNTYYYTEFQNGVFNLTTESNSILLSLGPVSGVLTDVSGPNCCLGSTYRVFKFDNGWDGTTSLKNLMHYQQGIRTNTWSHFDYGSVVSNSLAYNGSPLPPIYDPDDIPTTLPVLVIYGGRDNVAPPGGARAFMSHLRSSVSSNNVAVLLPEYAHFDLLYSVNRTQDVFMPVLQFLERQRTLQ